MGRCRSLQPLWQPGCREAGGRHFGTHVTQASSPSPGPHPGRSPGAWRTSGSNPTPHPGLGEASREGEASPHSHQAPACVGAGPDHSFARTMHQGRLLCCQRGEGKPCRGLCQPSPPAVRAHQAALDASSRLVSHKLLFKEIPGPAPLPSPGAPPAKQQPPLSLFGHTSRRTRTGWFLLVCVRIRSRQTCLTVSRNVLLILRC